MKSPEAVRPHPPAQPAGPATPKARPRPAAQAASLGAPGSGYLPLNPIRAPSLWVTTKKIAYDSILRKQNFIPRVLFILIDPGRLPPLLRLPGTWINRIFFFLFSFFKMSIAKHWAFTLNNYTDDDLSRFSQPIPGTTYHVVGLEVGESGTPHLQGHVSMAVKKRLAFMRSLIPGAHLTVARNLAASILYCKKGGDFRECGSAPGGSGTRSDLDAFKEAVKAGISSLSVVREQFSDVYARYPKFCQEYIADKKTPQPVTAHPLRGWQESLYARLRGQRDGRSIVFVVDQVGNAGKSWFVDYYSSLHENTLCILPGKKADMVYAFSTCGFDPRVVFVDAPRSKQGEYIQYDFLEEIKNGRIFCTKYHSFMVRFAPPHVVVMMNSEPDRSKLSEDRVVEIHI